MPFQPAYDAPPDRLPYDLPAGRTGCLMLHGFMGSPKSSRPMAGYLAARGISMRCPLLPGHGHWPDKLHGFSRQTWLDEAEEAFLALREQCDEIFLIGHSMGCVLSARLALKYDGVCGLIMLAPPYELPDGRLRWLARLRIVKTWFYPLTLRGLRELVYERLHDFDPTLDFDDPAIQARLPQMTRLSIRSIHEMVQMTNHGRELWPRLNRPVLILQGGRDEAVSPGSAQRVYAALPHPANEIEHYPDAGHELMRPFDPAHSHVWERIYRFIQLHSSRYNHL